MRNNITFITVKHQFEGTHRYPDAPEEVSYLRNEHRHVFHVEVEIEVFHDDRELEFIMVKHVLEAYFESTKDSEFNLVKLGSLSCEMIAEGVQDHIKRLYPLPDGCMGFDNSREERIVNIRVSEDGENGVRIVEI